MRVLLTVLIISSASHLWAQEFFLGAKAGVQGYGMSFGDKDLKDRFKSALGGGYNVGVLINFPLPADFGLVAELNYSKKGRKMRFNSDQWTNNSKYTFYEVPVLLRKYWKLNLYEFDSKWYINVGPNISYWAGGKGKIETQGPGLDYSIKFADEAEFDLTTMYLVDVNRYIFGLDFGVGFMADVLGNQTFFVEARFSYGHTYLGNTDSANLYILGFEDDMRNSYRLFNLSAGYAIHLDIQDAKKGKSTAKKRKMR